MAWLELHTVLIRHRKLKKLARKLNIKPVQAVGHLTTLWANVLELAENGDITKWSIEDIADYSGYEGNAKEFYQILLNNGDGFIDEKEGIRLIHDWFDYAGRYLKAKYKSNNPNKLAEIQALYGQTTVRQQSDNGSPTIITNLSNQYTHTGLACKEDILKILSAYKQKQGWEKVPPSFYKRNTEAAKTLIKEMGVDEGIKAIEWWADFSSQKGLAWTLETVIKKLPDYFKKGTKKSIPVFEHPQPINEEQRKKVAELIHETAQKLKEVK